MRLLLNAAVLLAALLTTNAVAHAQAARTSYRLDQVVTMLNGGMTTSQVLAAIRAGCVGFHLTGSADTELRRAGADAALLSGLRDMCNTAPPRETDPGPDPRGLREDTVLIEGTLPPGWSRVVNQLEPSQNRLITLTRDGFVIVSAPGWCPARDTLVYRPGETTRWTPTLRARPWLGGC